MNVNAHVFKTFWNLGLVRIHGNFTSESCLTLLTATLSEFGLNLHEDIFGLCTDGASVMKCFGRRSERHHQVCLVHGIHLAVVAVLYKRKQNSPSNSDITVDDDDDDDDDCDDSDGHLIIPDEDDDDDDDDTDGPLVIPDEDEGEFEESISELIEKVRKCVRMFRKSPLKLETLKKHSGSETTLILDCKTRWNSMVDMLERMVLMKEAVQKSMIDLREPAMLNDQEFETLDDIVQCLKPVKLAVEALCRRDANLVSADVAINFMMQKLHSGVSELSRNLFEELKGRILERRSFLSEVASYLHFGCIKEQPGHILGYFVKADRKDIVANLKILVDMFGRNILPDDYDSMMNEDTPEASESLLLEVSLECELSVAIKEAMGFKAKPTGPTNSVRNPDAFIRSEIKKEMASFEKTGSRGKLLQEVKDRIMTLPPSSVESERAFSAANGFCRKIRTRLSDRSLNALVFLQSYYKNHPC